MGAPSKSMQVRTRKKLYILLDLNHCKAVYAIEQVVQTAGRENNGPKKDITLHNQGLARFFRPLAEEAEMESLNRYRKKKKRH